MIRVHDSRRLCPTKMAMWTAVLVLPLLLLAGRQLNAQTSTITGTVVDPSGAVVAGAHVQIYNAATSGLTRETTTNATGAFELLPLLAGTYNIKITAQGMQEFDRNGIVLDQDQQFGLGEFRLTLGQTTQTVTVTSATPTIDTTSSNNAAVIDQRQVVEQPLNGRDFESLLTTTAGVTTNNTSQFRLVFNQTDDFYVNGMRGTDNNFFLDGIINTDIGANDGEYTDLSVDAVGEFKTLTGNYDAEYGRSPGIMILVNTKSGGQQFHGTLYEFNRNTDYDANSWFNSHEGIGRSILRFNQFGGNVGGYIPIPKISPRSNKKAFFFFNYEGTRASEPSGNSYYTMPVPGMLGLDTSGNNLNYADLSPMYRQGPMCTYYNGGPAGACTPITVSGYQSDPQTNSAKLPAGEVQNGQAFVPGTVTYDAAGEVTGGTPIPDNKIASSQFNTQYGAMINDISPGYKGNFDRSIYPNGFGDEEQVNFQDTYVFYKNQYAVRVDYTFGPKANAFFRYVDDRQQEHKGFGIFSGPSFPIVPQYREKPGKSWAWELTNVISPTLTNEVSVGWLHLTQIVQIVPGTPKADYDKATQGWTVSDLYPSTNTNDVAPAIADGTYVSTGVFPPGWISTGNTVVANDDVSKVWKDHLFKFGILLDLNENGQEGSWQEPMSLSFNASNQNPNNANNGMANMLLGNMTTTSQTNAFVYGHFHMYQYEGYAQDTWKVAPRWTLDYGVRYQFLGPTYTTGQYHQYYFEPDMYLPSQAVTLDTDPNKPGNVPTQGSICASDNALQTANGSSCSSVTNFGNPYNGMVREGTDGLPKGGMDFRYNNVGPRFGFAWDVFGNGKTAIRGGYGIFYERYQQNTFNFGGISNPPVVYTPTIYGGNIANISTAEVNAAPLTPSGGVLTVLQKGMIPTTAGYNIGIEQALPSNMAFTASYIGNQSRHQIYLHELEQLPLGYTNVLNPNILGTVNNVANAILPYQGYSSIIQTVMGASSGYNALQFKLIRRFSNTLTINADYTWSKATDLEDVDTDQNTIPDYTQLSKFYAPAGYDRRNVFNVQYVYNLPRFQSSSKLVQETAGGWEISGITQFWGGSPCLAGNSPTSDSCDLSATGNLGNGGWGHIRPDYVGGSWATSHSHNVPAGQFPMWFNPAVFAVPANGSFGSFHRNTIYGPGINNWNFSLFKNFLIHEETSFQLRFEGYNVFNHTQWANENTSLSAPDVAGTTFSGANAGSSGQINSVRDPRVLQLAGKFYF
jgi:hypothetical protein